MENIDEKIIIVNIKFFKEGIYIIDVVFEVIIFVGFF